MSEEELGGRDRRSKQRCEFVLDAATDERRRAVVERMRERRRRLDQVELELERPEERRRSSEGMDGRADVVAKARERQLRSPGSTADRVARLEDEDRASCLREGHRSRQAVRPGPDDHGIYVPTTPEAPLAASFQHARALRVHASVLTKPSPPELGPDHLNQPAAIALA